MEVQQIPLFDYDSLDRDTRVFVQEKAQAIHTRLKRTAEDIIAIGQDLIAVKTRLQHGSFLPWIQAEFDMGYHTAVNFMQVAERFGDKNRNFLDFPVSVLYALAKPSTPDSLIDRVESGQISPTLPAIREAKQEIQQEAQQQNLTPQQFIGEVFPGFTERKQEQAQRFEQWQGDNVELGLDAWGDVPPANEETPVSSIHPLERPLYEVFVQAVTPNAQTIHSSEVFIPETRETPTETNFDAKEKHDAHVMRVMGSSESPEWYTPQDIINLVCEMFGTIDTDPCSNSHETPIIPAQTLYTKEDDGLSQIWRGRTYLNPPYGTEIGKWTDKLIAEYKQDNVTEALALLPARIDTVWFSPLYEYLMCNVRGRIQFANSPYSAPFPCIIVYLGTRLERFIEVFSQLGPIMHRIG